MAVVGQVSRDNPAHDRHKHTGTPCPPAPTSGHTKTALLSAEHKPPSLAVDELGLPAELRERQQWVCWRWARRKGKWTKEPVDVKTDRLASTTNPTTWSTFDETLRRYQGSRGKLDGIGFVFCTDDPYCGVDLDDALRDGTLEPWAKEILDKLDSYTEVSPSGTGVKIFLKSQMPGDRHRTKFRTGEIEFYDAGRYFAMTGRPIGGNAKSVEPRQAELAQVYQAVFGPTTAQAQGRAHVAPSRRQH